MENNYILLLDDFINRVFISKDEVELLTEYVNLGSKAVQIITKNQTVLNAHKVGDGIHHHKLEKEVYESIYGNRKPILLSSVEDYRDMNVNIPKENISNVGLRYMSYTFTVDNEIKYKNTCALYVNYNKINTYQKKILIATILTMLKKDPNTEIMDYYHKKIFDMKDLLKIKGKDLYIKDPDEIILSDNSDYISDISYKYNNKHSII